ncbi:hypothetical protein K5I29_08080 [Flavobacterium agricola]|uniref:D-3-phosphoglycerate dehydrogenase n=1 Tax=Flavobacterium agricola TaxID=2870839 RepID=A0ABY6LY88_9FLAO|nr:NAD(P)-dependent oxidoreductase [Flavobacterium agricola]UYW00507.1 hypothetical protein K5I29_08080 [Flavobacterium agricola]
MKNGRMQIVITENEDFNPLVIEGLKKIGDVKTYNVASTSELIEVIKDAEVLFVRLRFKLTESVLRQAPKLKYILTATTGLDHIDLDYFESVDGQVISLKGATDFLNSIPATAEHTWALLLALMRNLPAAYADVQQGFWRRDLFKGNNLSEKKIGILGLGRVGVQVAHYARAFNMQIGYFDILNKNATNLIQFKTAKELFAWADIISIHIPLNAENIHYVNADLLNGLQSNAVLINTSRGAVVDESELISKIKNKQIKGYATDVLENELEIDIHTNELLKLSKSGYNVIITPHIAGATFESMHKTEEFIFKKFLK